MLNEILEGLKTLVTRRGPGGTGEKRRFVRLKCRYKVTCSTEKQAFVATVVDMGLLGVHLEVRDRLKPGQVVHVTYTTERPPFAVDTVKCKVVWSRKLKTEKIEAGLRYDDSKANLERSWVKVILRELGFDEDSIFQRRKDRRAVAMLPAELRRAGSETRAVRVLNLGVGGALLQLHDRPEKGHVLSLVIGPALGLPVLAVSGPVVSTRYEPQSQSWFCGLRFGNLGPKHLDLLSHYIVNLLKTPSA